MTEPGQADQGAGTGETTEGDAGDEGGAEDSGAEQGDATEGEDETTEGGTEGETTEGEADGGATEGETTEGGTEGETTEGGATSQDASSTEGAANTLAATPSLSSLEDSIMLADVEGVHDVYVFAKLTGYDTAGNEATDRSWITIGKLTGVNITDPAEFGNGNSAAEDSIEWGIATQAIEDGSLVTVDGFDSTLFDPSDVTWTELKVVAGAPDFGISGDCWHLDGAVELGKVAVNYHLLTDGKQTDMKTDFSGVSVGTTMDFTTTAYANKFASEGYTLDATQGGDTSITVKSGDGNGVDLYYNKVTKSSCTLKYVTYDASGNEVELQKPVALDDLTIGETLTKAVTDAPTIAGYTLNEDKSTLSTTVVADAASNTITFVYDKKTNLSYTVNYYWGTEGSDDPTLVSTQTVPNQTFGDQVTVMPTNVPNGYTLVPGQAAGKTITIGGDANLNVVNFYCYKNVTLKAASGDKLTYDGNKHTASGYTATVDLDGETVDDFALTYVTAAGSGTDAGTYDVNFYLNGRVLSTDYVVGLWSGKYVVAKAETGSFTIDSAPLEVTTGSDTKTYDGTPLTSDEVTVTGLVNGETLVAAATGSQTEVGGTEGNNAASFDWESEGTTAELGNYALTVTPGTLTVTAQSITPGADPADPGPPTRASPSPTPPTPPTTAPPRSSPSRCSTRTATRSPRAWTTPSPTPGTPPTPAP